MKGIVKIIGIIIGLLIVWVVALALALPSIISTNWGQNTLVSIVNSQIPGKLNIQKMHFSWFGGQSIQGFELKDPEGRTVLSFDNFTSDSTLWQLLRDTPQIGQTHLDMLNASVYQDANGITNIQRAISKEYKDSEISTSPSTQITLPFRGEIEMKESTIRLMPYKGKLITISNVNAHLSIPKASDSMALHIDGLTKQDELSGNFEVDIALSGFGPGGVFELVRNAKGLPKIPSNGEIRLKAKVTNLPVDVLDQIVAMQNPSMAGLLRAALGEKLDLVIDKSISSDGIVLQALVKTPTLDLGINGKVSEEGNFILSKPAMLRFTVTPNFIKEAMKSDSKVFLTNATQLELVLDQLLIPINFLESEKEWIDLANMELVAYMNTQPAQFSIQDNMYVLKNTTAVLKYAKDRQILTMHGHGEMGQTGQLAQIQLDAKVMHPFVKSPIAADVQFVMTGIPTVLIDRFFMPEKGLLVDTLGPKVEAKIQMIAEGDHTLANVSMDSAGLSLPSLKFVIGDRITLQEPAEMSINITPQIASKFMPEDIKLLSPTLATLRLHDLSFPCPCGNETLSLEKIYVIGDLLANAVSLSGLPGDAGVRFTNFQAHIEGDSLASAHTNASANMQWLDDNSTLAKAWGNSTQINASAKLALHDNNLIDLDGIKISLNSESARLNLAGRLKDSSQFSLTEPAVLNYILVPETFQKLGLMDGKSVKLKQPVNAQFIVNKLHLPIVPQMLAHLEASGKIYMDSLAIEGSKDGNLSASLQKLDIPWKISGPDNSIFLDLGAKTSIAQQPQEGQLSATVILHNWHRDGALKFGKLIVDTRASLQGLPVSILGVLSGKESLIEILGNSLDVELIAKLDAFKNAQEKTGGKLEFKVQGDQLQSHAVLQVSDAITLNDPSKPAALHWVITPERFAALRKLMGQEGEDKLVLAEPVTIDAKITELNLPWLEKVSDPETNGTQYQPAKMLGLQDLVMTADLSINKIVAINKTDGQKVNFKDIGAHVTTPKLFQQLAFNLSAEEVLDDAAKGQSIISMKGKIVNPFTQEGSINLAGMSIDLHADVNHLPIVMLCNVACLDPKLQEQIGALIGDTLDMKMNAKLQKMNGPIDIDLKGNNGKLYLDGQLTDGVLTLNKPLTAEVAVTPKLSKSLLQELVPFLSAAIGSDNPVKVTINPDGFAMPIYPFNLNGIKMNRGIVELGKIKFSQEGQLGQILSLLRAVVSTNSEQLNVSFTPLYIAMLNGVVKLERMDMLVTEKYPIAIWGKVDFAKDRVKLNIGLSARTLYNAFSIKGLDDKDMMVLPLTGTLDNASIDKGKAAAKITALIAQGQGGTKGLLLGGVLDMIGGGLGDDKVPPPTTQPLPWKVGIDEETGSDATQPQKKEKALKNPFKHIEKEASSLLNIFR